MPEIPNKLYFRIGEVSKLLNVEPYVLRYWESEFPDIKPSKSKSGQRLYKRRDVETLVKIKELLYDERYTIDGARKRIKDTMRADFRDVKPVEEHGIPTQLEAFPTEKEVEDEVTAVKAAGISSTHSKTLQKIKRDLLEVLDIVKG